MVTILAIALLIAVVILFLSLNKLSDRFFDLEWKLLKNVDARLDRLEARLDAREGGHPDVATTPREDQSVVQAEASRGEEFSDLTLTESSSSPGERTSPPPVVPQRPPVAQQATPSRTREEWEALIGGKILNRIGALAIVIAMGFFMKYAVDQNWVDEGLRVLIGGAVGFGLWAWAFFLHKKDFQVFAQGIVGAGIGILYLSVYATHNFYALVSFEAAFILMAVVTLLTLVQSLYYGSLAVAILGLLGGYLTPFLLEGGETQTLGLLSYVFFLNAGLLAIVYRKGWWPVELMTFAGMWLVFLSWYFNLYTADELSVSVLFVSLFWLSYYLLGLTGSPREEALRYVRRSTMLANALITFLLLYDILDPLYHAWMGGLTLLLAGAYFAQAIWLTRTKRSDEADQMQNVLTAMVLVVIATWIQFEELDTVIAWSIEATALAFIGKRLGVRYVRVAAILLFIMAFMKFLGTSGTLLYAPLGGFVPILNERALALILLSGGLLATSFVSKDHPSKDDGWIVGFSRYGSPALLFLLVGLEVNDHFNLLSLSAGPRDEPYYMFARPVWMSLFWSLLSIPFVGAGIWKKAQDLLVAGVIILAVAGSMIFLRGLMFDPPSMYEPLFNIRAMALLVVGLVFAGTGRLMSFSNAPHDLLPVIRKAAQYGSLLLLLSLLTGETRDFFEAQIARIGETSDIEIAYLRNLQQLSLSGVWLVYSVMMIGFGIWRSQREVRIAAFALFALTILKIFLYDLSYLETLYRIFSFIGLGLVLLGVSYAYQKYKHVILGTTEIDPDQPPKE